MREKDKDKDDDIKKKIPPIKVKTVELDDTDKLTELIDSLFGDNDDDDDDDEDDDENENPLNFEFLFMKTGDYTILTQLEEKDDTFWDWLNEEYKEPDQK